MHHAYNKKRCGIGRFHLCFWYVRIPGRYDMPASSSDLSRRPRPLTESPLRQTVTVVRVKLPEGETARLLELGLRVGGPVTPLEGSDEGPLMLGIGYGRIGVDRETARKIYVC